jgi:L,D-peptidoglycan transpeptidase YkuD (ErfK/YbiS/YcfS/YnhG family)
MIKTFLILLNLSIILSASEQIVLVVSENFNSPTAYLECYEGSKLVLGKTEVNIGKKGLGWGLGEKKLTYTKNEPLKYEGDKKAPIGIFKLSSIYGYASKSDFKMPYLHASKNLICVDDSNSPFYNQIITAHGDEKSFEYMRRKDKLYELGIVVQHNSMAQPQRGSCIFLHVQKSLGSPTSGCTSMSLKTIQQISSWLDSTKNPILIQIPKSLSREVINLYPELRDSKLLKENKF